MALALISSAFANGGSIPPQYTCDGANRSPLLRWSGVPAGTRSFVLTVHDPDAPNGDFTHWVLFDIPASAREIHEGAAVAAAGMPGTNDFGKLGYGGPCPPPGRGRHRYLFTLYALNRPHLGLHRGARRAAVEAALHGHVLGQAQLMGVYERKQR
jgi:Raf kinase inhibitor-like YbhB/YbcL family protein